MKNWRVQNRFKETLGVQKYIQKYLLGVQNCRKLLLVGVLFLYFGCERSETSYLEYNPCEAPEYQSVTSWDEIKTVLPSGKTYYTLCNKAQILSIETHNKDNALTANFVVANDIDLEGATSKAFINGVYTGEFQGVLRKNAQGVLEFTSIKNFIISNASQNEITYEGQQLVYGFFAILGPGAVLKNIHFNNVTLVWTVDRAVDNIGSLAGLSRGSIEGVNVSSNLPENFSANNIYVGALLGQLGLDSNDVYGDITSSHSYIINAEALGNNANFSSDVGLKYAGNGPCSVTSNYKLNHRCDN